MDIYSVLPAKNSPEDIFLAYVWYNIAALLGNEMAPTNKESIAKEMTSTQIEKAQELSKQCYNSNYKDCD